MSPGQEVRQKCVVCGGAGERCVTSVTFVSAKPMRFDKPHGPEVRERWRVLEREMGWALLEAVADVTRRTWVREEHLVRVPPSERTQRQKKPRPRVADGIPVYRRRRTA